MSFLRRSRCLSEPHSPNSSAKSHAPASPTAFDPRSSVDKRETRLVLAKNSAIHHAPSALISFPARHSSVVAALVTSARASSFAPAHRMALFPRSSLATPSSSAEPSARAPSGPTALHARSSSPTTTLFAPSAGDDRDARLATRTALMASASADAPAGPMPLNPSFRTSRLCATGSDASVELEVETSSRVQSARAKTSSFDPEPRAESSALFRIAAANAAAPASPHPLCRRPSSQSACALNRSPPETDAANPAPRRVACATSSSATAATPAAPMRLRERSSVLSRGHPLRTRASASAHAPSVPMWFPLKSRCSKAHPPAFPRAQTGESATPSSGVAVFAAKTFSASFDQQSASASARAAFFPRSFPETSSDLRLGTAPLSARAS
mmetsp:Transcript_7608/g.31687  ORF Transcript_7608/g.31687 Transcript_7608/m.31687 type:complete len:384 (+) Transcript_7608:214-1365(+)